VQLQLQQLNNGSLRFLIFEIIVCCLLGFESRPGEAAQVIDYGHGQQPDETRDKGSRHFRFVDLIKSCMLLVISSTDIACCLLCFIR